MANLPQIDRGTSYPISYTHKQNGVLYDHQITAYFTVKAVQFDDSASDMTAIIKKTATGAHGVVDLSLNPTDTSYNDGTSTFITPQNAYYDIVVVQEDGLRYKMVEGRVKVGGHPTNRGI